MIILDTNVLSEMMRPVPASSVQDWLGVVTDELRTMAVSEAEILAGLAQMPEGRRRHELETGAARVFSIAFTGSIRPFDSEAARHYAEVMVICRRLGRPTEPVDAMIAAIARANGAPIATRKHFEGCGVALHDPWRNG